MTDPPSPRVKAFRMVTLVLVTGVGAWILIAGGPKWYYSLVLFSMVGMQGVLIHLEHKIERLKRRLGR